MKGAVYLFQIKVQSSIFFLMIRWRLLSNNLSSSLFMAVMKEIQLTIFLKNMLLMQPLSYEDLFASYIDSPFLHEEEGGRQHLALQVGILCLLDKEIGL